MAVTAQQLLDQVNAAISDYLTNGTVQRFSIRGKDITLGTLRELLELRSQVIKEAAEEANGGVSVIRGRLRPEEE